MKKVRGRVMASEPLFEEQSDAVKVSETPYPTNGSGKNLAKVGDIKCVFLYPMPDSSLRVKLCFFFCHHSDSARRSRMTAELFLFCHDVLTCVRKHAPIASQARHFPPYSGEANDEGRKQSSFINVLTVE